MIRPPFCTPEPTRLAGDTEPPPASTLVEQLENVLDHHGVAVVLVPLVSGAPYFLDDAGELRRVPFVFGGTFDAIAAILAHKIGGALVLDGDEAVAAAKAGRLDLKQMADVANIGIMRAKPTPGARS